MKPNIGRLDAFCRVSMGLTIVACATANLVLKPRSITHIACAAIGSMKVAEGVTRFCPLTQFIAESEKMYGPSQTEKH